MAWVVFIAATEHWYDWQRPISLEFGGDVPAYEQIARAAPSFPDKPLATQHAERFPVHWLVGLLGRATGLHVAYWLTAAVALVALVVVMHLVLVRLGARLGVYAICMGVLVGNAYAFRFELAVPAMVSDTVFTVGLA